MVATSIFMMIMLMAMGALVVSSDSARKGQALRATMDNVNFAMDTMTRSIRMGTNYVCVTGTGGSVGTLPVDCPLGSLEGGGSAIAFKPAPPNQASQIIYRWINRTPINIDDPLTHTVQRCDGTGESSCVDIVSPEVDITDLKFFVNGSNTEDMGDFVQPSVYIIMRGTVLVRGEPTTFALQTMASQRTAE
jgi:hypothetical protein